MTSRRHGSRNTHHTHRHVPARPAGLQDSVPSVARWQKFRPKSSKGAAEIKICGRILADFTKNRQKKGPQKIFKRSSLFLAVITTYNIHQDKIKFDF
jgi:hypothetical protein